MHIEYAYTDVRDKLMEKLAAFWCSIAHDSPMWPIHGRYVCRVCGREYPVEWSEEAVEELPSCDKLRVYQHAVAGSHR
jgi:hypothetical protein